MGHIMYFLQCPLFTFEKTTDKIYYLLIRLRSNSTQTQRCINLCFAICAQIFPFPVYTIRFNNLLFRILLCIKLILLINFNNLLSRKEFRIHNSQILQYVIWAALRLG